MTIKDLRVLYFRHRVRPETHELYISKEDSKDILLEFYGRCEVHINFDEFFDQVKNGTYEKLFLKRLPMNFFSDKPTGFVQVKQYVTQLVDMDYGIVQE
jgi:hypothetical protein